MDEIAQHLDSDRLNGWKEIAAYLGKSVRSAQRWEGELGLPVHRITTPDGGQIIYASRRAIDSWRVAQRTLREEADEAAVDVAAPPAATTTRRTGRARWWFVITLSHAVAVGAGIGIGLTLTPVLGEPARFEVIGQQIHALTDSGREIWTYKLGQTVARPQTLVSDVTKAGDLDGDGQLEFAVAVSFSAVNWVSDTRSDAVLLFDRRGRVKQQIQPDLRFNEGGRTFEGPWRVVEMVFATNSKRLWLSFRHHSWHPAFILEITADGKQTLRYVQAGPVVCMREWQTPNGTYLAAGGTDMGRRLPSVAVVDLQEQPARWPGPNDLTCDGCPQNRPRAMVLLPDSEIGQILARPSGLTYRVIPIKDTLRMETDTGVRPTSLAWLNPDFTISNFMHPAPYWTRHRTLESEGLIKHTAEQCPEFKTPSQAHVWIRESGWRSFDVPLSERPTVDTRVRQQASSQDVK